MSYSIIAKSKHGNCTICQAESVACIKVGKKLICTNCRGTQKAKEQIEKANLRDKVRGLGKNQDKILVNDAADRSNLIADIDYVVSRIVRIQFSGINGSVKCYTCNTVRHFSMMDAGHFISRSHMGLRFDYKFNIRPQCKTCNQHNHGMSDKFAEELEMEQKGIVEQLKEQSREPYKYSIDELKGLLFDLRQKLKPLELKLKK